MLNLEFLAQEIEIVLKSKNLTEILIKREVAVRHAGTAAGIVWLYLQPLLIVAAYYLILDVVFAMRLGADAPIREVGAFLIVGSLPWMAFCDALSRGANSLIDAGSMLQKNALPIVLFPLKAVIGSAVIFGPLIILMAIFYGPIHHFPIALLAIVPMLLAQTILTLLLAYLLAISAAALRDTLQFLGFFLSVGIYLTPVLFPITLFPENWRWALWANPMTAFVLGYQTILLKAEWPPISLWFVILVWVSVAALLLSSVLKGSRDQLVDWL